MSSFEILQDRVIWRCSGETVEVLPWGNDSLRVLACMMGEPQLTEYALLEPKNGEVKIEFDGTTAVIRHGKIRAEIKTISYRRDRCQIRFFNDKDELLLEEMGDQGCLNLYPHTYTPILGGDHKIMCSFEAHDDEKFYGMGQYQNGFINFKGCVLELAHRNAQSSVPFCVSSRGYGFLWHNPATGTVNFAKNFTQWIADSSKQVDYWVTAGDTPAEILSSYANATGHVPMMPEYGLGFWQCKLRYWNQEQLLEVAREYKRRGIPLDVIVCDFFHWPYMGDYRFDEEFFPDPEAMCRELKEMGTELMVSVWPQVDLRSENFQEMKSHNLLIRQEYGVPVSMQFQGDSLFFDATNPNARKYVWEKCKQNYADKGVRLFWLDEAEPEFGTYDYPNYRYYAGPGPQVTNWYPQCFSRAFYEGMVEKEDGKVVNLVRCAWAGSQRYGALVWSGDIQCTWKAMRQQVCIGLSMGMAGLPWWTMDIGGFAGGVTKDEGFREMLVRWFEWGTFCPVMRLHGDRQPAERVYRADGTRMQNSGSDNEIWSFGDEATPILTNYILLRDRMRDYTRECMKQAHEDGAPVMRTLFYDFPQDKNTWEIQDEFLFGSDILVAPVLESGMTEREVYLPAGARWVCFWSGKEFEGGQTVTVPTPLDKIPVFLRDGKHSELRA